MKKKIQCHKWKLFKIYFTQKTSETNKIRFKYIITYRGNGRAVKITNKAKINYSVYFKDGSLLETSVEEVANFNGVFSIQRKNSGRYQPILASVGQNDRMIEGFKEGVRLLEEGDKATLFLPYQ